MRRAPAVALLVLIVASLGGCGNKGPLFLPPAKPSTPAPATLPPPSPSSSATPAAATTVASPDSPR